MNMQVSKKLRIVGKPGLAVKLQQRGSQDIEAVGEPEVFFNGNLGADGQATLDVPRGSILVLLSDHPGGAIRIEVGLDGALQTVTIEAD